ncbi:MAG: hypothetical protein ICV71_02855 [Thermoleophilia bacterium]|nr:hypothetical protein [Thermoleophilia bacterium]MDQ3857077.1 hypothetical protein [Actinomycetota bacterium]
MPTAWLVELERSLAENGGTEELASALVVLASVAGERVDLEDSERQGAVRRALLLLAAGGDPSRGLDLHGRAVTALSDDLRDVDRQIALEDGIRALRPSATGLPHVSEALRALEGAPDIAWRAFAASLLADELGGEH